MKSASVLACIVPLVASLKYALPKSFAADSTCPFPENYTVEDFSTFTAAGSNDTTLSFNYVDEGTNITSFCQKNATSPNLSSSPYAAARYGCDNTNVKFIWQDSKLTILEAACPNTSEGGFDASGSVLPALACKNCTDGAGVDCTSNGTIAGEFSSLNPSTNSVAKRLRNY